MESLTEYQKELINRLLAYGYHGDDITHPFVIDTVKKLIKTFKGGK